MEVRQERRERWGWLVLIKVIRRAWRPRAGISQLRFCLSCRLSLVFTVWGFFVCVLFLFLCFLGVSVVVFSGEGAAGEGKRASEAGTTLSAEPDRGLYPTTLRS